MKYSFGVNAYLLEAEGGAELKPVVVNVGVDAAACSKLLETSAWNTIIDFDDHFEDCNLDWRNPAFKVA